MTVAVEQSTTCSKCGLTTTMPQLLKENPRSFRLGKTRKYLLCPRCIVNDSFVYHCVMFVLCAVCAVLFITAYYLSPGKHRDDDTFGFFGLLFGGLAFCVPIMVVIHELAHAIVGWAAGLKVMGVQIGIGPRLFLLRVTNRSFVDFRICPIAGLCFSYPIRIDEKRWPIALMIAAGPAVHLIAAAAIGFISPTALPGLHRGQAGIGGSSHFFWSTRCYPLAVSRRSICSLEVEASQAT